MPGLAKCWHGRSDGHVNAVTTARGEEKLNVIALGISPILIAGRVSTAVLPTAFFLQISPVRPAAHDSPR
jgi:hypothetical protein